MAGQEYSHEILIEGMPIGRADLSGGNNNEFSPSAEAIGEFKLQTGAIGAQYNGGQTAVANFTIRSGTNGLHGSGFYYGQNEALDAANLNTTTAGAKKAKFREHNYGYSVGGPVYIPKIYDGRNKTFFFTNLERDDRNQQAITGLGTVPTAEFKKGDFSKLLDPAYTGDPRSGTQVGTDALGRPIVFGQIYDPSTTRDSWRRDRSRSFRGQHHPAIDAGIRWRRTSFRRSASRTRRCRRCCATSRRINGQPVFHLQTWGVKIDHQLNSKNQLSGYYNHSYRSRLQQWRRAASCRSPARPPVPGSSRSLRDTWPGSHSLPPSRPRIINRAAAGYQPVPEPEWGLPDHHQREPGLDHRTAKPARHDVPGDPVQRAGIGAAGQQHRPYGRRLRGYQSERQLDFPG